MVYLILLYLNQVHLNTADGFIKAYSGGKLGHVATEWQSKINDTGVFDVSYTFNARGTKFLDLNGDGYADIFKSAYRKWDQTVSVTDPDCGGELAYNGYEVRVWIYRPNLESYQKLCGDDLLDFIPWRQGKVGEVPLIVFSATFSDTPTKQFGFATGTHVADINADGFIDVIKASSGKSIRTPGNAPQPGYEIFLNNGFGFEQQGTWRLPNNPFKPYFVKNALGGGELGGLKVADINGDGFPDLVVNFLVEGTGSYLLPVFSTYDSGVGVWLNNAKNGWDYSQSYSQSLESLNNQNNDPKYFDLTRRITNVYPYQPAGIPFKWAGAFGFTLMDVNNDRRSDLVESRCASIDSSQQSCSGRIWLNTGSGWEQTSSLSCPNGF